MFQKKKSFYFDKNQLIGQGAFSKVYKNTKYSTDSDETTAVKVYQKSKCNQNVIDHAKKQRNILKMIDSEYICSYKQSRQSQTRFYMVQKLEQGITLNQLIQKNKKIKANQVVKIIKSLLKGLQYLHKKGIMHRDLKPQNIMYNRQNGKTVILDLGFACYFHKNDQRILSANVGTPNYMSPQMLTGQKYNSKSDIWSLGVIIYELLTGKLPFQGRNQKQIVNQIMDKKIQLKSIYNSSLQILISRCLKIDFRQRIDWEQLFQWKQSQKLARFSYSIKIKQPSSSQKKQHKRYNSYAFSSINSINLQESHQRQQCNCIIF